MKEIKILKLPSEKYSHFLQRKKKNGKENTHKHTNTIEV